MEWWVDYCYTEVTEPVTKALTDTGAAPTAASNLDRGEPAAGTGGNNANPAPSSTTQHTGTSARRANKATALLSSTMEAVQSLKLEPDGIPPAIKLLSDHCRGGWNSLVRAYSFMWPVNDTGAPLQLSELNAARNHVYTDLLTGVVYYGVLTTPYGETLPYTDNKQELNLAVYECMRSALKRDPSLTFNPGCFSGNTKSVFCIPGTSPHPTPDLDTAAAAPASSSRGDGGSTSSAAGSLWKDMRAMCANMKHDYFNCIKNCGDDVSKQAALFAKRRRLPIDFSSRLTGIGEAVYDAAMLNQQYQAYFKFHKDRVGGGENSGGSGRGPGSSSRGAGGASQMGTTQPIKGFPTSQLEYIIEARLVMAPDKAKEPTAFVCDQLASSSYGARSQSAGSIRAKIYAQHNNSRLSIPNLYGKGTAVPPLSLLLQLGTMASFSEAGAMLSSYIDHGGTPVASRPTALSASVFGFTLPRERQESPQEEAQQPAQVQEEPVNQLPEEQAVQQQGQTGQHLEQQQAGQQQEQAGQQAVHLQQEQAGQQAGRQLGKPSAARPAASVSDESPANGGPPREASTVATTAVAAKADLLALEDIYLGDATARWLQDGDTKANPRAGRRRKIDEVVDDDLQVRKKAKKQVEKSREGGGSGKEAGGLAAGGRGKGPAGGSRTGHPAKYRAATTAVRRPGVKVNAAAVRKPGARGKAAVVEEDDEEGVAEDEEETEEEEASDSLSGSSSDEAAKSPSDSDDGGAAAPKALPVVPLGGRGRGRGRGRT
ncbi:hypothetical protein HXX76_009405 [Chlamydomonas incerta]|uniref:Uncharacterized protein n=1 Tax=Chlamydomonas incerta TaxID=51695 RepID=A0A835SI57_CHLIN|nr:hypothetical protein HXX76_012370 [Chlamydomonas incerta]KAG2431914.1 hypothetical protein HXX76_009405 [Chlamydomonas incerta]|eukprot:KAG2427434.1 hypothetical protein HXX76_012370 [Chlamydomonas incerta]